MATRPATRTDAGLPARPLPGSAAATRGRGIAGSSSGVTAVRLAGILAWALIGIITARALSVSERGVYATSVLAAELIVIISSSFSSGCTEQIATGRSSAPAVLRSGLELAVAVATGLLLISVALWKLWPGGPGTPVLLVGLLLFPGIVRNVVSATLVGKGSVSLGQFISNTGVFFGLVAVVGWLVTHPHSSAVPALVAWTGAQYFAAAFGTCFLAADLLRHVQRTPGLVRHVATFGTVAGLAGLVGLIQRRIDLLLVAALNGSHGAGVYSAATSVSELLLVIPVAIASAAVPLLGRARDDEIPQLLAAWCRQSVLLAAAAAAGVLVMGPFALRLAFGAAYGEAAGPLRVLAVGAVLIAPQALVVTYLYVRVGRPGIALLMVSVAAGAELLLALLLIPPLGLIGAALADASAYFAGAIAMAAVLRRFAGLSVPETWFPTRADVAVYYRVARRGLNTLHRQLRAPTTP